MVILNSDKRVHDFAYPKTSQIVFDLPKREDYVYNDMKLLLQFSPISTTKIRTYARFCDAIFLFAFDKIILRFTGKDIYTIYTDAMYSRFIQDKKQELYVLSQLQGIG